MVSRVRIVVVALAFAALASMRMDAQDFVLGVHSGETHTRQLTRQGYTTFERGSTLGLAGTMTMKPWLAFSLELLVVDKGMLTPDKPHTFFEVPYMLRLSTPWEFWTMRPYAALGAAYAYELTCESECSSPDRVTTVFSLVSAMGATFTFNRWELSLEQRHTRGQNSMDRRSDLRATSDVRSLVVRLSFKIPGVVPDWM